LPQVENEKRSGGNVWSKGRSGEEND